MAISRGRPTKYSAELAERICLHLSYGATHRLAAESEGIDEKTFYNWLKKPDFFQAVRASEARARTQKLALLHMAAQRGSVAAMTWLLERLDPQAYGEPPKRLQVSGDDGGPVRFSIAIDRAGRTEPDL